MYCKFKTSVMISVGFIVNIFIKHLNFFKLVTSLTKSH